MRQRLEERVPKTPLLLVPGLLCSPRLFGPQVAALSEVADIVVPDWRKAPLSIFDSWETTARWVLGQMPSPKFALAGLSLGGMIAVEIMQIAAAIKGSALIVIEQCGHLITMEKPNETKAILSKWLS